MVVGEVQVFLKTLETRSGHVVSVEVVHDVDEHEEGAARVELALHALFDGGAMLRVHRKGGGAGILGGFDGCFGCCRVIVWLLVCHLE